MNGADAQGGGARRRARRLDALPQAAQQPRDARHPAQRGTENRAWPV
jgi:hypothetical protein